tara:strand:- start:2257 stop:2379 length:123 start_codon:yes stop_codon:yes gene_type:complete
MLVLDGRLMLPLMPMIVVVDIVTSRLFEMQGHNGNKHANI